MKNSLLLAAVILALSACATAPEPADADKAIAAAEKEVAAAKKSGNLWNNTEKFLDEAKKAKANGDKAIKSEKMAEAETFFADAIKNAKKATDEAKLAQIQKMEQANPKVHYPN